MYSNSFIVFCGDAWVAVNDGELVAVEDSYENALNSQYPLEKRCFKL